MDAVDVPDDVLEHLADVLRADEHRLRTRERLSPPRRQLLVAAHRVLELGAVCLDRVRRPARGADGPAEQDVVREDDVGGQALAESRGIQLDVALALVARQVLQQSRLEPLVAVEHEDRQQPADLGTHDLGAAEVVQLRVPLLAEEDDVVPGAAPLARKRARVDVRAGAAQEVPVPEKNPQVRWK